MKLDLPFLDIESAAYSDTGQCLYILNDAQLLRLPLARVMQYAAGELHIENFFQDALECMEECSTFSAQPSSTLIAATDFEDRTLVFDTTTHETVFDEVQQDQTRTSAQLSLSPDGRFLAVLDEIDSEEEALLLAQWRLIETATGKSQNLFGEKTTKPPLLLGWWSPEVICAYADETFHFSHVTSGQQTSHRAPPGSILETFTCSPSLNQAAFSLTIDDVSTTYLLSRRAGNFALDKLSDDLEPLGWHKHQLVVSSADRLELLDTKTKEKQFLIKFNEPFESVIILPDGKLILVDSNSMTMLTIEH